MNSTSSLQLLSVRFELDVDKNYDSGKMFEEVPLLVKLFSYL